MKVLFRLDTGEYHGAGHLFRCLNLARALYSYGAEILFVTKSYQQNLINFIDDDFEVIAIEPTIVRADFDDSNYQTWNMETAEDEFSRLLKIIESQSITHLVLDHYGIDKAFDDLVMARTNVKYLVLEDLFHPRNCHILLNQNLGSEVGKYSDSSFRQLLLGPDYALMDRSFSVYRQQLIKKKAIKNVLVFFGGADKTDEIGKVVDALETLPLQENYRIIIAPNHPRFEELTARIKNIPKAVHQGIVRDFAALLAESDLMLGASGSVNWERLCLGVPSFIITIADNQRAVAHELNSRGLVKFVGDGRYTTADDWTNAINSIQLMQDELLKMGKRGMAITSGNGAALVAKTLMELEL